MACDYCKGPIRDYGNGSFIMEGSKVIPAFFEHTPLKLRVQVIEWDDGTIWKRLQAVFDVDVELDVSIKYSGEDDGALCRYVPEHFGYCEDFYFEINHCPVCGDDIRAVYRRSMRTEGVEGKY